MTWPKEHPNYMPSYDELYAENASPDASTPPPAENVVKLRPEHADDDDGGDGGDGVRRGKARQADELIDLFHDGYEVGCSLEGEPFAVRHDGAGVALPLRGSRSGLRADLAARYRRSTGRAPSAGSLADALLVIEGEASEAEPTALHLRVAHHDDAVVIDLGDTDGRVVVIKPSGWEVTDRSPVLFRRTALTGRLPVPVPGGDLDDVRRLLNLRAEMWPLVLAYLVAAFLPTIPHAVLAVLGMQGTGKSTFVRLLCRLVDPSPAQLRTAPKDVETWVLAASGSYVVALDNISDLSAWLSDALCRASTGEGLVRRRLYSDTDLSVVAFRRVVALTSIDAGSLRGDLADRLLLVDLDRIDPGDRRLDSDIEERFEAVWPQAFGALLDLTSAVLETLPDVHLDRPPRMADFARVVAAVDDVLGTDALGRYVKQGQRVAEDVIDSSPVASAVCAFMDKRTDWTGTASELLAEITPDPAPKSWPKTARGLSGSLTRSEPALLEVGIEITRQDRTGTARRLTLTKKKKEGDQTVTTVTTVTTHDGHDGHDGSAPTPSIGAS